MDGDSGGTREAISSTVAGFRGGTTDEFGHEEFFVFVD